MTSRIGPNVGIEVCMQIVREYLRISGNHLPRKNRCSLKPLLAPTVVPLSPTHLKATILPTICILCYKRALPACNRHCEHAKSLFIIALLGEAGCAITILAHLTFLIIITYMMQMQNHHMSLSFQHKNLKQL